MILYVSRACHILLDTSCVHDFSLVTGSLWVLLLYSTVIAGVVVEMFPFV